MFDCVPFGGCYLPCMLAWACIDTVRASIVQSETEVYIQQNYIQLF